MQNNFIQTLLQNFKNLNSLPPQEQNRQLAPIFGQAAMGATTAPGGPMIPRGDVEFARRLAGKTQGLQQLGIEDINNLMKIARSNLRIPEKLLGRLSTEQIIAELLGLAEKPRGR